MSISSYLFWFIAALALHIGDAAFIGKTSASLVTNPTANGMLREHGSKSALFALPTLVKKAKQASLREYVESGEMEVGVMELYERIKERRDGIDLSTQTPGPLQQALSKRKGTITVIAEFKRKSSMNVNGRIHETFEPDVLSPTFRENGCSAIAVMADERMGGCSYADIAMFVEEQRRARNDVPGPVPVINNDLIIDELQIARTAMYGCAACVINMKFVENSELVNLLKASKAVDIEAIVAVSSLEEAQEAVNLGARMVSTIHLEGVDAMATVIEGLQIPDGQQVCTIANILVRNDKEVQEIEHAWALRDKGFNCVWVGEALYKAGADAVETPGNIIKSMKSKSSLKWASPRVKSGRGEGAREYLGDILM